MMKYLLMIISIVELCPEVRSSQSLCNHQRFDPQVEIERIRENIRTNSFVVLPGPTMRLLLKSFGAAEDDLRAMELGYIHAELPLDLQPVMFHRHIAAHRMLLDTVNKDISPAYANTCSQIPLKEIASTAGRTDKLDYQR